MTSTTSALAILLPPWVDEVVQKIRTVHDKQVLRWPAHINLFFPFVPSTNEDEVKVTAAMLLDAAAAKQTVDVCLDKFEYFVHKGSATVYLSPSTTSSKGLTEFYNSIAPLFPQLVKADAYGAKGPWKPHMTVAQATNEKEAIKLVATLQKDWKPARFTLDTLFWLTRTATSPFSALKSFPSGACRPRLPPPPHQP